jgi:hypothetical protein
MIKSVSPVHLCRSSERRAVDQDGMTLFVPSHWEKTSVGGSAGCRSSLLPVT